jgi:outer membrane protein OmpA-like peptidoglycan-associated protein
MKFLSTILLSCALAYPTIAQPTKNKDDKALARINNEAVKAMEYQEYNTAIEIYKDLLKARPNELEYNYQMGVCLINSEKKREAYTYFKKVYDNSPTFKPELEYMMAMGEHYQGNYEKAKNYYTKGKENLEKYRSEVSADTKMSKKNKVKKTAQIDEQIKDCAKRIQETESGLKYEKTPLNASLENLGANINTSYPEYTPLMPRDSSFIIFTSRRNTTTGGKMDWSDNEYFEDIYIATRDKNGKFGKAQLLPNVNEKYHDAAAALSADGQTLYLYRDNGKSKGDFYISTRGTASTDDKKKTKKSNIKTDVFSKPKKLNDKINTKSQETSLCLSEDGNTMYFASDRPGGKGGLDIYKSKKEGNDWGTPTNVSEVNTEYDDDAPFLSFDGKTLYFSSKGHDTMGGYDVFKSQDENGKWGKPENLSAPINGPEDDMHIMMTPDNANAYYVSSDEAGFGSKDIYKIGAPKIDLVKIDKAGLTITPPNMQIVKLDTMNKKNIKPNFKFLVTFDYDKSNLNRPVSKKSCEDLLKFMQDNPAVRVELGGHTCNIGSQTYNQALSLKRAQAVSNYLIERGVDANRLEVKGYEFSEGIAPNDNESNRSKNRRTEFKVIDK